MPEVTVVNKVKDRCKMMQRTPCGTYEFGWLVYNKRDRKKDYFNKAGEGTYAEATSWMSAEFIKIRRVRVGEKSYSSGGGK